MRGIGARDEIEGMLATQMVATHIAAIRVLRQLKGSETITQQDSNGNLAVKLLRTFTMQLDEGFLLRRLQRHEFQRPPRCVED